VIALPGAGVPEPRQANESHGWVAVFRRWVAQAWVGEAGTALAAASSRRWRPGSVCKLSPEQAQELARIQEAQPALGVRRI
jgi:hypothetical protein